MTKTHRQVMMPHEVYQDLLRVQESVKARDHRKIPLWMCMEERVREQDRWKDQDIFGLAKKRNRRGNLMDTFTIMLLLAGGLLCMMVFILLINGLNTSVQASNIPSQGKTFMSNIQTQNGWSLDWIFVMALINLPLVSAILAYFNNIPPFLFWSSFGLLLLVIMIANVLADAYTNTISVNGMTTLVSSIPMTNWIMSHFVIYAFLSGVIILMGVFLKPRGQPGYA